MNAKLAYQKLFGFKVNYSGSKCTFTAKNMERNTYPSPPNKPTPSYSSSGYMKAWCSDGFSGIDGLQLSSLQIPPLVNPTDVLVKVSAASVNPLDIHILNQYGATLFNIMNSINKLSSGCSGFSDPDSSVVGGRDFSGHVVRVGQAVDGVKPMDRVWGIVSPHRTKGSHSEYVITDASNVCLMPRNLSNVEAASLPYVALTGWSAAIISGGLKPYDCLGSQILIIGASGGVGSFLTQLLSTWGAQVVGLCSEDAFESVISCGASQVFDYHDSGSKTELMSQPRFDLIIDAGGHPDVRWAEALVPWKNASYISLSSPVLRNTDDFGFAVGVLKSVGELVQENISALTQGRLVKWAYFMPNYDALRHIAKMAEEGRIKSVVDKVFGVEEGSLAYRHVFSGPSRGKTVINFELDLPS